MILMYLYLGILVAIASPVVSYLGPDDRYDFGLDRTLRECEPLSPQEKYARGMALQGRLGTYYDREIFDCRPNLFDAGERDRYAALLEEAVPPFLDGLAASVVGLEQRQPALRQTVWTVSVQGNVPYAPRLQKSIVVRLGEALGAARVGRTPLSHNVPRIEVVLQRTAIAGALFEAQYVDLEGKVHPL